MAGCTASAYSSCEFNITTCVENFDEVIKTVLEEPMRLVGMYIAAASGVCVLAMATDVFNGFRSKRFWFPCKYFSLNAFSLTLLAVAMKLPVDLTTDMSLGCDWFAKLSSLVFLLTAMANFMPSLGSMTDQEILANVTALGIFVFTVAVNVWIQFFQIHKFLPNSGVTQVGSLDVPIQILLLLVAFVSLSVMLMTAKQVVESKYQAMHKVAPDKKEEDSLRALKRNWMMAETGSPQFVIARSAVCTAASAICLTSSIAFGMVLIFVVNAMGIKEFWKSETMYGWSTKLILCVQTTGIVVGSVAPASRCFFAVSNQCSRIFHKKYKRNGLSVEKYWIQRLEEWRDSTLDLKIPYEKPRKYLHGAKRVVLNFLIGVQILIVGASKIVVLISALLMLPFLCCFKKSNKNKNSSNHDSPGARISLSSSALQLEDEAELPGRTRKNIRLRADKLIEAGKSQQPADLIELLQRRREFSGITRFDIQIPSLQSQEPPNCWALPVVALSSIAICLPNISVCEVAKLVSGVNEGLSIVKIIETSTDTNGELVSIRRAADVACGIYSKWITKITEAPSGKKSKEILQELSKKAEKIIIKFKQRAENFLMENPLNWPPKEIAAMALYRICRNILEDLEREFRGRSPDDEVLFKRLSVTIADVLAACLAYFVCVITRRCHRNAIEERERNVYEALFLMGKTEEIRKHVPQRECLCLNHNKAVCVEEWRALIQEENECVVDSTAIVVKTV